MDSRITTLSPAFTACPTLAATLTTLPGTEAVTFTAPAPAAGVAAFGAAAGAALGAASELLLVRIRFLFLQQLLHMLYHLL